MQELFNLFEEMGYKDLYFRQGSLANKDYPNSFFTYWNFDTPDLRNRDNKVKTYSEDVMVYFYTNDRKLIYSEMDLFINNVKKKKGFTVMSKPYDCPTDRNDYFGRLVRIKIVHEEE